jgi:hypothetical protein
MASAYIRSMVFSTIVAQYGNGFSLFPHPACGRDRECGRFHGCKGGKQREVSKGGMAATGKPGLPLLRCQHGNLGKPGGVGYCQIGKHLAIQIYIGLF